MITQISRKSTKYRVFWYTEGVFIVILKTYFFLRFLEHMKYGPKNLKIYDGIYVKQIEKELDARLKTSGMTFIWSSFPQSVSGNPER